MANAGASAGYPIGLSYGQKAPTPSGIEHGEDVEVPDGTHLYSPKYGQVIYAKNNAVTGGTIGIFSGGHTYWFGHLKSFGVGEGDTVSVGDFIGLTGGGKNDPMRGDATGPHLWFAVSDGYSTTLSNLINPKPFLDQMTMFQGGGSTAVNAALVPPASTSPTPSKPASSFLGIQYGSYFKIVGGALILLIAAVIILASIGLRSGKAGEVAESVPLVGGGVKAVRRRRKASRAEGEKNTRQQQALERRETSRQLRENEEVGSRGKVIDLDKQERQERRERIDKWFKDQGAA